MAKLGYDKFKSVRLPTCKPGHAILSKKDLEKMKKFNVREELKQYEDEKE